MPSCIVNLLIIMRIHKMLKSASAVRLLHCRFFFISPEGCFVEVDFTNDFFVYRRFISNFVICIVMYKCVKTI